MATTSRPNRGTFLTIYRCVSIFLLLLIAVLVVIDIFVVRGRADNSATVSAEEITAQGTFPKEGGKIVGTEGVIRHEEGLSGEFFSLEKADNGSFSEEEGRIIYEQGEVIVPNIIDGANQLKELDGHLVYVKYFDDGTSRWLLSWCHTGA